MENIAFIFGQIGIFGAIGIILGVLVTLFTLLLYLIGLKDASFFDDVEEKDFTGKEIYFIGYAFLKLIRYKYNSKGDDTLRGHLNILYDSRLSDYYLRVIRSSQVTMSLIAFMLGWLCFAISNDFLFIFVAIVLAGSAFWYFGSLISNKIKRRKSEMISDFAEVVSKLALLTNTGMILRQAWDETANAGTSAIYEEMRRTSSQIKNGVPEVNAFSEFGVRSNLQEIKKFVSLLSQGLSKGNSELVPMLMNQSSEVWAIKKQVILRKGEQAASKLIGPMLLMFFGIIIIVVVPMVSNLGL